MCVCVCVCVSRVRPSLSRLYVFASSRGTSLDSSTFVCRHAVALFPRGTACCPPACFVRPILGMKFARLSPARPLSSSAALDPRRGIRGISAASVPHARHFHLEFQLPIMLQCNDPPMLRGNIIDSSVKLVPELGENSVSNFRRGEIKESLGTKFLGSFKSLNRALS